MTRATKITDLDEIADLVGVNSVLSQNMAEVFELIAKCQALLGGHFSLQSGKHSGFFFRFRHIGQVPIASERVSRLLLDAFPREIPSDAVILAAESAAFHLASSVCRAIGTPRRATAKIDLRRRPIPDLRSGEIQRGDRVVVVTDAVTTGSSLRTLLKLATEKGGSISAVLVFATLAPAAFTKVLNEHGVPGAWLVQTLWPMWDAKNCELCAEGDRPVPAFELN
jgi:orotate phosphoribosyltransferase